MLHHGRAMPASHLLFSQQIFFFIRMQADTARVVWSWNPRDPSSPSQISQHEYQGTTSLNLLGGLNEERQDPSGAASFVMRNENASLLF